MNIHFERLQTLVANMEYYYLNFWKHIYYDDSKVHYKNAILFYKNNENGKFHNFFSGRISSFLYKGNCEYLENRNKKTFSNENMTPSSDELCKLIKTNIDILDDIFTISPKLPNNIIAFRTEKREKDEVMCNLKKNDVIEIPNYWSTTISPYYEFTDPTKITIKFIINLPKNTKCYYINNPFFIDNEYKYNSKYVKGFNEYEILLPRNCIYKILRKIKLSNTIIYVIDLVKQLENIKITDSYKVPDFKVATKNIKSMQIIENKIKSKNLDLINEKIKYIKFNVKVSNNNKKLMKFKGKIYFVKYETIDKDITFIDKIKDNENYLSFTNNLKSTKLKSKYIYLKYDVFNNIKIFNYFKNLKLNKNYNFNKIFLFYDNETNFNNNSILTSDFFLYKSNTLPNTSKIIQKDLSNNLFKVVHTEPIFIMLKLQVKKKFNYYELFNTEKINLHNKFTLKINSKTKHTVNKFHYYILNGYLS
jgi:hypothetical protein